MSGIRLSVVPRRVTALRIAAAALAVAAVVEPTVARGGRPRPALRVVDVSASVGDALSDRGGARGGAEAGQEVIAFADGVRPVVAGEDPLGLPRGATRIATALRAAGERLGSEPGDVRLETDGRDTEGGAAAAAAELVARGHRVYVSPPARPAADVGLLFAGAEGTAASGPVAVRVKVSSSTSGRVRLRLAREGRAVATTEVDVAPAEVREAVLFDPEAPSTSAAYEVTLVALPGTPDDDVENDRLLVPVRRGGTAVVVGTWAGAATPDGGLAIRRLDALAAGDVETADALVVSNVPWDAIGRAGVDAIGRYVAAGGRVLVLGGPLAYAGGNWRGTSWESLLPLTSKPQEGGGLAIVLAVDRSGSTGESGPGGAPALASLTTAVLRAIEGLAPGESALVLPFSDRPGAPLGPGWVRADDADGRRALDLAVKALTSGGGTRLDLAVVAAAERLRGSAARSKRVVLLTDGDPDHPPQPAAFEEASRALAAAGADFGALVVGDPEAARVLREAFHASNEDVVLLRDAKEIPDELFRALGRARAKDEVREDRFVVHPARGVLDGIGLDALAPSRVADLQPAAGADVFARADGVTWRLPYAASLGRGAGRVVGLAWGPAFEREALRPAACATLVPLLQRLVSESDRGLAGEIERGRLVVAAGPGSSGLGTAYARRGLTGAPETLLETKPGIYEGAVPDGDASEATIFFEAGNGPERPAPRPVRIASRPPPEHRGSGVDEGMLRAIASAGGGRVLAANESAPSAQAASPTSLSPALLVAALALFVVERILTARRGRALAAREREAAEARKRKAGKEAAVA